MCEDNQVTISNQMLIMDTQYSENRTESLHLRAEKAIDKLQGHISLYSTPELSRLVGEAKPNETSISTQTLKEVISVLQDTIRNTSTLELDAALDNFAAEESHLLNEKVRSLTADQYRLIEIIRELSPVPIAEVEAIERSLRQAAHSKVS